MTIERSRRVTEIRGLALRVALLFLALLPCAALHAAPPGAATAPLRVPAHGADVDQFIIRFKPGTRERGQSVARQAALEQLGRAVGLKLSWVRRMSSDGDVVRADRPLGPERAESFLRRLRNDPRVEAAQVDHWFYAASDPLYVRQWALDTQFNRYTARTFPAIAWPNWRGQGAVVAVLDSGIVDHVDLQANILPGYDFITDFDSAYDGNGRDPDAHDPGNQVPAGICSNLPDGTPESSWHGTQVAGIIAATRYDEGIIGVAYEAKVLPVRVLGRCGVQESDLVDAIKWAAGIHVDGVPDNPTPANVINMSLGGTHWCQAETQRAINAAVARGVTVVTAAGNEASDAAWSSPGNCENVVNVGAVDQNGARAGYSNFGAKVDLVAPGGDLTWNMDIEAADPGILSTSYLSADCTLAPCYRAGLGTSFAAPHVAGAVALMHSARPRAPADVERRLKSSTRYDDPTAYCVRGCGAGLLDAHGAALVSTADVYIEVPQALTIVEGDGPKILRVTYTLTAARGQPTPFDVYTTSYHSDRTPPQALEEIHYLPLPRTTLVIPAGDTSASVDITILGDDFQGDNRFFLVAAEVADETGVRVPRNRTRVNIVDDDSPRFSISDEETFGGGNLVFRISMDKPAEVTTGYLVRTAGGTLDPYPDPNYFSGLIAPGDTQAFVVVPTQSGATSQQSFESVIYWGSIERWFGSSIADAVGIGTVLDGRPRTLSVDDVSVLEADDGSRKAVFTLLLSRPAPGPVTWTAQTFDGKAIAGLDYVGLAPDMGTIPKGDVAATFEVPLLGDDLDEHDEDFYVQITASGSGTVVGDGIGHGTILNDDKPLLAIADAEVTEGNSGKKQLVFDVSLSEPTLDDVTFVVTTTGMSATASDFVSRQFADTIPAQHMQREIAIDINGDFDIEGNETFRVEIANVSGAVAIRDVAIGTILNDDGPVLSVADAGIVEGHAGSRSLTFTASLLSPAPAAVTFTASTSNGTAAAGEDYQATTLTGLTLAQGQQSKSFSIPLKPDTKIELDETFVVTLGSVTGASVGRGTATGTIANDDKPLLTIGDAFVTEGDDGSRFAQFTATLSEQAPWAVTFDAATTGAGTATAGTDYVPGDVPGLSIDEGMTTRTFAVEITGDETIENNETFVVALSDVVGALVSDGSGLGTITNDDKPTLTLEDADVTEGNAGWKVATFTATLSEPAPYAITFDAATTGAGTALSGIDYFAANFTGLVISAGATAKTVSVTINGDPTIENDETFVLALGNASGATLADGNALGTIVNDDEPSLSVADVSITEGNSGSKIATFTVSLSAPAPYPIGFDIWTTGAGTATEDVDYLAVDLAGLQFAPGVTSRTFGLTIYGDTDIEASESFVFAVTEVDGAKVGDGTALGTIVNDDKPTLTIADLSVTEGNSGTKAASFTLTLSAPAPYPITFSAATTGAGTATAGTDYVAANLTGQAIAANTTTKTVTVTLNGDTAIENNETFVLALSNVAGAIVGDGTALGTIVNDDKPTLTIADVAITEGHSGTKLATFTVTLSKPAPYAVSFNAATTGAGTATAGVDYVALSATGLTVPAGQTAKTFAVTLKGDTTVEPNETYVVSITGVSGANIGDGSALGTISNDD
jgi:subtilisin family serine protease